MSDSYFAQGVGANCPLGLYLDNNYISSAPDPFIDPESQSGSRTLPVLKKSPVS